MLIVIVSDIISRILHKGENLIQLLGVKIIVPEIAVADKCHFAVILAGGNTEILLVGNTDLKLTL